MYNSTVFPTESICSPWHHPNFITSVFTTLRVRWDLGRGFTHSVEPTRLSDNATGKISSLTGLQRTMIWSFLKGLRYENSKRLNVFPTHGCAFSPKAICCLSPRTCRSLRSTFPSACRTREHLAVTHGGCCDESLLLNNRLNKNHLCRTPFRMRVCKAGSTLGKERWRQRLSLPPASSLCLMGSGLHQDNFSCIPKSFRCGR